MTETLGYRGRLSVSVYASFTRLARRADRLAVLRLVRSNNYFSIGRFNGLANSLGCHDKEKTAQAALRTTGVVNQP